MCKFSFDSRQFKTGKSFIGTIRYASRASHIGHEIARKDDLESLMYVGVYLLKGYPKLKYFKKITMVGS